MTNNFMRKINPSDALFNKQLGQWARPPKTVLTLDQIYFARNPAIGLRSLARLLVKTMKTENPRMAAIADHPMFEEFILEECRNARACRGPYADIV